MRILVTGGAGYIGSHTALKLLRAGHEVYVIDSLCNSSKHALERVQKLANRSLQFYQCDVRSLCALKWVFDSFKPDATIHFAGLKSVSESVLHPAVYNEVNVEGTSNVLSAMDHAGCEKLVFSSSATVYGNPIYLPCDEDHPCDPVNPYGRTKLIGENLICEWANRKQDRHAVALRYFNPVGADESGMLGEDPKGVPNNLMPYIAQVAVGSRECLIVFGDDYETLDGTGVRDYIHVLDLAQAHVSSVEQLDKLSQFEVINIGTGAGYSVLQILMEFEKQSGKAIPWKVSARRKGDVPAIWADTTKAFNKLGFTAVRGAAEMCLDTWRWQKINPDGYI